MANTLGNLWLDGDVPTRQRMNWKNNAIRTGAEISTIDYATGIVSRYAFGGDVTDFFAFANLTANGSPTYTEGVYGKAIVLNGSSQYLQAATNAKHDQTTTSFGITFWIYLGAIPGTFAYIISKRNDAAGTNPGYQIYVNSTGNIVAELSDGTTLVTATGGTSLSTATWYHVDVFFNRGTAINVYVNAVLDKSQAQTTSTTITNTQVFTVGRSSSSSAHFLNGTIDHLQVYNSSASLDLTMSQILYSDCHSGMQVYCTIDGSGFVKDTEYVRDAENLVWKTLNVASAINTVSNATPSPLKLSLTFTAVLGGVSGTTLTKTIGLSSGFSVDQLNISKSITGMSSVASVDQLNISKSITGMSSVASVNQLNANVTTGGLSTSH